MSSNTTPSKTISVCPEHGTQHSLTSGLCVYPTCVAKIVSFHASKNKSIYLFWKRVRQYGLKEDFIIWAVKELLREEKVHGKKPTLNPSWLFLRLKHYLWHEANKSSNPYWRVPETSQSKLQKATIYYEDLKEYYRKQDKEYVFDSIINKGIEYSNDGNNHPTPLEEMEFYELKDYIVKTWGEPWYLYASGDITVTDTARLTGLKLAEVKSIWTDTIAPAIRKDYFGHSKNSSKSVKNLKSQSKDQ